MQNAKHKGILKSAVVRKIRIQCGNGKEENGAVDKVEMTLHVLRWEIFHP